MRLSGIDLNLLVVLHALLEERTLTLAAKRIGLSQSATSHSLARLRALLDDPLFVRTPGGMVATERANALRGTVRTLLEQAELALRPERAFDARASNVRFVLGLDDATQSALLPALVKSLVQRAPHIALSAHAEAPESLADALESGRLDAAVTVPSGRLAHLPHVPLVRYRHVGVARSPDVMPRAPSLARFARARQVSIATPSSVDPDVNRWLAERGLERSIQVTVSSPFAVPAVVAATDLVAIVPDRLLSTHRAFARLHRFKPPLPIEDVEVALVYHPRTEKDPARRFLRERVIDCFASRTRRPAHS